jgi:hypothetical protein
VGSFVWSLRLLKDVIQYFCRCARNRKMSFLCLMVDYPTMGSLHLPRLTSIVLGIGIVAVSAMGTVALKHVGSAWRAQVTCPDGTLQCPDGSVVTRVSPDCDFGTCQKCGNWTLDEGETCEVGVCCAGGQICNIRTCMCESPAS